MQVSNIYRQKWYQGLCDMINEAPLGEKIWMDTRIIIPHEISSVSLRDIFTQENVIVSRQNSERVLNVSEVLNQFTFAMMETDT